VTPGLILNTSDDRLPIESPWRTRFELRHQPPVLVLDDGTLVYEVWFWSPDHGRWLVMSKGYDVEAQRHGVVFFDTLAQLKAVLGRLPRVQAAA